MKAFLSHSSKDKGLVSKVAEILGHGRCEYDEYTFEYVLNAQAIRRALHRSDLFVLFLSENSVNSNFVSEEVRTSLDLRASGKIKKVLIITLDNTSFRALPEWMQAINVIAKLASPQTCARKIEAELIALEAEQDVVESIYIPREEEAVKLRKVLSKPPGIAPVSVHAVGYPGVGRRTFLQKTLSNIYPRQIKTYARIRMSPYEGVNEFYRRLYDNFVVSSVNEKSANFEKFAESSLDDQVEVISDIIVQAMSHDEFILVEDDGGAYTDEGSYQPYISQIIQNLKGASRPFIGFSQTRMMPLKFKEEERSSYHIFISPLNSEKISELISFSLRDADIDFTAENLESLTSLIEGYPINVRLAVKAVESYGIEAFIADPSLLNDWKLKRAEDFISKIEFNNVEKDIIALLIDFHYLSFELIRKNMTNDIKEISEALRRLEDFCCIERRGTLYTIFAPIQSAASRDKRFKRNARWRGQVALNILDLVSDYTNDESVPVNILETAAKASIISGKYNGIAASFILPSHFLNLAQDAYADERWPDSLNFCKEAFKLKSRLSQDGLIELLRLWCITAIRINNPDEIEFALSELEKLKRFKVARRNIHFLRGFRLRLAKQYDAAEKQFVEAYRIAPKNMSINRELASLYRYRNEYSEAEIYARNAYEIRPTNAFVLDVLLETLLGKMSQGLAVDQDEIAYLFGELQKYGDVPGSSFYQTRIAQELFASNKKADALRAANIAVDRTPQFLPCYFLRAEIHISMNNVRAAKDDLKVINDILDKRGGFSEENEGRVVEIEIKILIEEENLRLARDRITRSQFLPRKTRQRLSKSLAKAISFSRKPLDSATIKWANEVLAKK